MRGLILPFLLLASAAHAEVYKCAVAGKTTYTDRPCTATAEPATLPPVTTVPPTASDDLARRHDQRLEQGRKARDREDARFLKRHAEQQQRAHRVRAAIIDHEVIQGMTASEVDSALGAADETLPDGSRRYWQDGQRTTVTFKDGVVSRIRIRQENRKK